MLVPAFFRGLRIPFDLHHLFVDLFPVNIVEMDLIPAQFRDLMIVDIVDISRFIQDRRHVGSHQAAGIIFPDDQRAVLPCREKFPRIIFKHHPESIGSPDTEHGPCQRLQRRAGFLIIIVDQLDRDLCVRLGIKCVTGLHQLVFQFLIILDNAVMYQHHRTVVRAVRVRIILRRLPVGRPAGMADAACSVHAAAVVRLLG